MARGHLGRLLGKKAGRGGQGGFDRFTDHAKETFKLARQEAQRFDHEYLGTEHILLGLVQERSGVAANVLKNMGIDLNKIRMEVEKTVKTGPSMVTMGELPFTPRAKKVLELSMEEAGNLGHNYIGTEHLLLGLIKESEGIAAQVLLDNGLQLSDARERVLDFLGAVPLMESLDDLQVWYASQCDGDWEHSYGIRIETLDSADPKLGRGAPPGWFVTVELDDTELEDRPFAELKDNYDEETAWMRCWRDGTSFKGACGPLRLGDVIEAFLVWAAASPDP